MVFSTRPGYLVVPSPLQAEVKRAQRQKIFSKLYMWWEERGEEVGEGGWGGSGGNSSVETLQVTHCIGSNASWPVGDFTYYLGLFLRETWIVDCSCLHVRSGNHARTIPHIVTPWHTKYIILMPRPHPAHSEVRGLVSQVKSLGYFQSDQWNHRAAFIGIMQMREQVLQWLGIVTPDPFSSRELGGVWIWD